MLTVYEDTENIFNALAAGATGYLLKRTKGAELLDAIHEVHRGGSPMTTHIARKVTQSFLKTGLAAQPTENLSNANRKSSIASARVFSTRKSPKNWVSATKPSIPISAASTKNFRSAPAPKPSPNSCAGDRPNAAFAQLHDLAKCHFAAVVCNSQVILHQPFAFRHSLFDRVTSSGDWRDRSTVCCPC